MKRTRRFSFGILTVLVMAFMCSAFAGEIHTPTNRMNNVKSGGYLTSPAQGDPLSISLDYLDANKAKLGLNAADIAGLEVVDRYTSKHSGVTHLYLSQTYRGIHVYNGIININVAANGAILNLGSNFISGINHKANLTTPVLSAVDAGRIAARDLGVRVPRSFGVVEEFGGSAKEVLLSNDGIASEEISAKLVYHNAGGDLARLAWQLVIHELSGNHIWIMHIDSENGKLLGKDDMVAHDHFGEAAPSTNGPAHRKPAILKTLDERGTANNVGGAETSQYEVFAMPLEHPDDGPRTIVASPFNATASPFGWHDTDGANGAEFTTTQGNNVHSYLDVDANNTPDATTVDGGAALDFTGTLVPEDSAEAAMVNLFYWNNIIHDVAYLYGFDEASGNFQQNNYGNGGLGNDYVFAEARDGSGTNNANFATPPDGSNPRMQMFLWTTTTPGRDGDFSNIIIVHEYGHGVSNRLTGGPSSASCLSNQEQMGEGWSDWLGLFFTAAETDTELTTRAVGTWVLGEVADEGAGIRDAPYTTNMAANSFTYGNLPGQSVPHGVGFVWATMLWDVYWALVNEYGFNTDFYGAWDTGGNNLAMQLVMDGMKLQPCNPGFVDGRDAILAADQALTGGANQCLIWEAFARRGLGASADQGSSGSTSDGTEAFDMPATCAFLTLVSDAPVACAGDSATATIAVGGAFAPDVNLNSTAPKGVSVSFDINPVTSVPQNVVATINVDAGVAAGDYTFTVSGTDSVPTTDELTINLTVFSGNAGDPTDAAPGEGDTDVSVTPIMSWTSGGNTQNYHVMLADNAAFKNPIVDTTTSETSLAVADALESETDYWWSLTAQNPCGNAATQTFMFTTAQVICDSPGVAIPDNDDTGVDVTLNVGSFGTLTNLDVSLDISHTWVGDLTLTLTHEDTGTSVVLLTNNGCREDDIDVTLSDSGTVSIQDVCETTVPTASGLFSPANPLAAFIGEDLSGTWTLNAVDGVGQDTGTINTWCLIPSTSGGGVGPVIGVDTSSITLNLERGDTASETVTVSNTGDVALTWDAEESGVVTALGGNEVVLSVDDGSEDTQVGDSGQFIWFNRFTPDASAFPILLNEIHVSVGTTLVSAGDPMDLLVFSDTDGDGDPGTGAVLLADFQVTVQTPGTLNVYVLDTPVLLEGPGDVLIGAINRAGSEGFDDFPASIDQTASQGRSWVGTWTVGDVPANDEITFPADEQWGTIDSFGLAGNWMIRGLGTSPTCGTTTDVPWLSLSPTSGTIMPGQSAEIQVDVNTAGVDNGTYLSGVCINNNDLGTGLVSIPLTLNLTGPESDPHTIGVFRPSNNRFFLDSGHGMSMGAPGDLPLVGDWNGDGIHDVGVFRPAGPGGVNTFFLRLRGGATFTGGSPTVSTRMGQEGDIPVVGDFDANGVSTIGVYRPSNANFYIRYGAYNGAVRRTGMGTAGDMPVIGDWDGDGHHTIGVYRPSNNTFYLRNSVTWGLAPSTKLLGSDERVIMGASGDMPLVGDWDGDGDSDIGVFRPSSNAFYMRVLGSDLNSAVSRDGLLGSDTRRHMGAPGDMPLIGVWE